MLSIAWHPVKLEWLGVTLSYGAVHICESGDGPLWEIGSSTSTSEIHQHDAEAWTFAFTKDDLGLLSGGDDAVLRYWTQGNDEVSITWQDRKLHQAGVTAILPLTNELVITGSYDDRVRLISFPAGGRRKTEAELNLGGGVWRLKLLGSYSMEGDRKISNIESESERYVPIPHHSIHKHARTSHDAV